MDDWLAEGLDGPSARTVRLNCNVLKLVTAVIGVEQRMLTAHDVRRALVHLAAGNSSRIVTLAHNALTRALRHAEANRHVAHNVAALVDTPKGQPGRPSKALTCRQLTYRDHREKRQQTVLRPSRASWPTQGLTGPEQTAGAVIAA